MQRGNRCTKGEHRNGQIKENSWSEGEDTRRAEEWTEEKGDIKENTGVEKGEQWSEGEETKRAEEWKE